MASKKKVVKKITEIEDVSQQAVEEVVESTFEDLDQSEQIVYLKEQLDNLRSYLQTKFQHDVIG